MRSLFFGWLTPCLWIFVLWEHIMSLPMGKCTAVFISNTSLLCMVLCSAVCLCLSWADTGTRENFCNILLSCKQSRSVHRSKFPGQLHRAVSVGKRAYLVRGLLGNLTLLQKGALFSVVPSGSMSQWAWIEALGAPSEHNFFLWRWLNTGSKQFVLAGPAWVRRLDKALLRGSFQLLRSVLQHFLKNWLPAWPSLVLKGAAGVMSMCCYI